MFVIKTFNGVYFCVWAAFALVFAVLSLIARKRGVEFASKMLSVIMIVMTAYFFVYKGMLIHDSDYQSIRSEHGLLPSLFLNELPLQLCNINLFLIPVGILLKRKNILAFSFFTAPLGALLALCMPSIGLSDDCFFIPRIFAYYTTHFAVFFGGLSLLSFGIYKPVYEDIPKALRTLILISLAVFAVNIIMKETGINPAANYLFTMNSEGNALLDILYKKIKIPYISVLPVLLVFAPYMYGVTALVNVFSKKGK